MRRTPAPIAALGVVIALGLSACGSGNDSKPTVDGSSATAGISAGCSLANPPVSTVPPPTSVEVGRARGTVGVVLDGSTTATSDLQTEAAALIRALTHAGLTPDVQITSADPEAFVSDARGVIGRGARVLILDSLDAPAAVRVERIADRAGVPVIDFDHVVPGGRARYLVSFDHEDIGKLQALTLTECLARQGVSDPRVILLNGGTDVDDNAVLQAKGAHEALDPLASSGRATIAQEASVKGWQVSNAAATFSLALRASDGQVDAVLAGDDAIAGAVIGELRSAGLDGRVAVAGLGATAEGVQNVTTGEQSMTVFEDPRLEADAAARLAAALVSGKEEAVAAMHLTTFDDPASPAHRLRAVLLPAEVITQANVADVPTTGQ